ncbi:MAG TPA: flagellar biosynthesis protein FlhA [Terriglobales bacterium]|nr:flagellar biosynthesis protein FlhA [Terriglobales bacterium]
MANQQKKNIKGHSETVLLTGILIGVFSLILPFPTFFLDLLIALNLIFSILLLLLVLQVKRPLEFSSYPGLILIYTLFRLSLGLGCTRAILSRANAGAIIQGFGSLAIRGDYVAGLLVVSTLFLIQFLVITKGVNRTSEVIARFFLDSLPGKQMAIEGELSSGLITQDEARKRREEVSKEGDFYGSMEGAIKFVRGEAILSFILILINLIAGFTIGILKQGMGYQDAFRTYALLSAGLGMVLQIPALLTSSTSGLIITRASSKKSFASEVLSQYVPQRKTLIIVLGAILLLGVISGFSLFAFLPLMVIGGSLGYFSLRRKGEGHQPDEEEEKISSETKIEKSEISVEPMRIDPIRIELGYGLLSLAQSSSSDNLFQTIPALRREVASEIGIRLPQVRVRDNLNLKPFEYSIILKEMELARRELFTDKFLVINPGDLPEIEGVETIEPAFSLPAKWIEQNRKKEAEDKGYNPIEPKAVLTTHLFELFKENAYELFGLQETKDLLEELKKQCPALVEEIYPGNLSLVNIQKVFQSLLKEKVPVKDLLTIFEVLAEKCPQVKEPVLLTEAVRAGLKRTITRQYLDSEEKITVFTLHPKLEQSFSAPVNPSDFKPVLKPELAQRLVNECRQKTEELKGQGSKPVVLVSARSRFPFRRFIGESLPDLGVLSYEEIVSGTRVYSIGNISLGNEFSGDEAQKQEIKSERL